MKNKHLVGVTVTKGKPLKFLFEDEWRTTKEICDTLNEREGCKKYVVLGEGVLQIYQPIECNFKITGVFEE